MYLFLSLNYRPLLYSVSAVTKNTSAENKDEPTLGALRLRGLVTTLRVVPSVGVGC